VTSGGGFVRVCLSAGASDRFYNATLLYGTRDWERVEMWKDSVVMANLIKNKKEKNVVILQDAFSFIWIIRCCSSGVEYCLVFQSRL
jgi:hypothetical protein